MRYMPIVTGLDVVLPTILGYVKMDEPDYDCDFQADCECEEIEPEWEWDNDSHVWVCSGCGAVQ